VIRFDHCPECGVIRPGHRRECSAYIRQFQTPLEVTERNADREALERWCRAFLAELGAFVIGGTVWYVFDLQRSSVAMACLVGFTAMFGLQVFTRRK